MDTIAKIRAEIERRITDNTFGAKLELMDLHSFLDTLQEESVEKTCKTCGFYENNCPFIRDKFIPYPNKVCKDYTFSTLKAEQGIVSDDLEEEIDRVIADYSFTKTIDSGGFKTTVLDYVKIARHFFELGRNTGKEDKK